MTLQLQDLLDRLDERLVRQAFTHSSLVEDRGRSYERLEFLGDSVLSLCITSELYRRFPHHTEGHLARLRAYVVSRETCARVATTYDLGRRLARAAPSGHDPEEVRQLSRNSNVLADLTEAVIGAAFLTFGLETVRPAVIEAFDEHIGFAERSHVDNKTELQEVLAKSARTVVYRVVEQTGPAHDRRFQVEAVVDGEVLGSGQGQSKKRAEQMAAGEALVQLSSSERSQRPRKVRLLARRRRPAALAGEGQTSADAAFDESAETPPAAAADEAVDFAASDETSPAAGGASPGAADRVLETVSPTAAEAEPETPPAATADTVPETPSAAGDDTAQETAPGRRGRSRRRRPRRAAAGD